MTRFLLWTGGQKIQETMLIMLILLISNEKLAELAR